MNFDYDKHLVLKVMAGSRAYGTETEHSDTDWKGIIIPPIDCLIGNHNFEQHQGKFEEENTESTYFGLKKFCQLASKCNPNVIEILFVRDEDILKSSKWAEELRNNRNIFLSQAAIYSFSGYAMSQLNRIKLHRAWLLSPPSHKPTRGEFNLPEKTLVPKDQLGAAKALCRRHLHELVPMLEEASNQEKEKFWDNMGKVFVLYAQSRGVSVSDRENKFLDRIGAAFDIVFHRLPKDSMVEWYEAEDELQNQIGHQLGFSSDFMECLKNEKSYSQAKQSWDQYNHWVKTRNPARAEIEARYGYDCKHAMHLVRLMRMGKELITTGTMNVYRPDREELLAIRNGAWEYDELIEWAEERDAEMQKLVKSKKSAIPNRPNYQAINQLLVDQHLSFNHLAYTWGH